MMEQRRAVLPMIIAVVGLVLLAAELLCTLACLLPEPTGFLLDLQGMVAPLLAPLQPWMFYVILGVTFALLVALPVTLAVIALVTRFSPSPYPEGLDLSRMNADQYRIYCEIHDFLLKGGFQIYPGYGCDNVYVNNVLFCTITKKGKAVYVNINKDMRRFDGRLDRSGYIAIYHTPGLPQAKERIYSIYKAYFQQFRQQPKQRPARPVAMPIRPAAMPARPQGAGPRPTGTAAKPAPASKK